MCIENKGKKKKKMINEECLNQIKEKHSHKSFINGLIERDIEPKTLERYVFIGQFVDTYSYCIEKKVRNELCIKYNIIKYTIEYDLNYFIELMRKEFKCVCKVDIMNKFLIYDPIDKIYLTIGSTCIKTFTPHLIKYLKPVCLKCGASGKHGVNKNGYCKDCIDDICNYCRINNVYKNKLCKECHKGKCLKCVKLIDNELKIYKELQICKDCDNTICKECNNEKKFKKGLCKECFKGRCEKCCNVISDEYEIYKKLDKCFNCDDTICKICNLNELYKNKLCKECHKGKCIKCMNKCDEYICEDCDINCKQCKNTEKYKNNYCKECHKGKCVICIGYVKQPFPICYTCNKNQPKCKCGKNLYKDYDTCYNCMDICDCGSRIYNRIDYNKRFDKCYNCSKGFNLL